MPQNKSGEMIYEDINEVLSPPSSVIVRYGIGLIAGIVLILLVVLWLVKYTDGYRFTAVLKFTETLPVYAGKADAEILTGRGLNGAMVKKGDVLLVTQNAQTGLHDTTRSPKDGKLVLLRNTLEGQILPAGVPLYLIASGKTSQQGRLYLNREENTALVQLGQPVHFRPAGGREGLDIKGEILSLPYFTEGSNLAVVDVRLFLNPNDILANTQMQGLAFIPSGRKPLLARLFGKR
jgi:hypothetical protein